MPVRIDRTRKYENALTSVYEKLNREIKRDVNYPANMFALKRIYDDLVYTSTRVAIEKSYDEGVNYVGYKTKIDTYQTITDTINIKDQTDESVNKFWNIIQSDANRDLGNETATFIATPEKPLFDTSYWLAQAAGNAAFHALNTATVSKAKQVEDQVVAVKKRNDSLDSLQALGAAGNLLATTALLSQEGETDIPNPDEFGGEEGIDAGDEPAQFVFTWVTAGDERVCEEFDGEEGCAPRDGREYLSDDPDLEEPPLHDNCRCYLEMELLDVDIERTV
jgi:hypothetical protein